MCPARFSVRPDSPSPVVLACGHVVKLRPTHTPEPGKLIFCIRCDGYSHRPFDLRRDVDGKPMLDEWRWRCRFGRGCNNGRRRYGQSRENALYAASQHSRKHPQHEIWLIDPLGRVAERWGGSLDDAGQPLWVKGVAVWRKPDTEARERYGMDNDNPSF